MRASSSNFNVPAKGQAESVANEHCSRQLRAHFHSKFIQRLLLSPRGYPIRVAIMRRDIFTLSSLNQMRMRSAPRPWSASQHSPLKRSEKPLDRVTSYPRYHAIMGCSTIPYKEPRSGELHPPPTLEAHPPWRHTYYPTTSVMALNLTNIQGDICRNTSFPAQGTSE